MYLIREIIFIRTILSFVHGAKILGVFPVHSGSHFTLGFSLMRELAYKGHEVTFINSFPQKEPIRNLRDVSVEEIEISVTEFVNDLERFGKMNYWDQLVFMSTLGKTYTENVLKHKNVQNLLNSGEKFDLVIMEHFWNEAMTIFAHHFNCPLVYFSTGPTSIFNSHLLANPSFSSYVPNFLTTHGSRMTFLERVTNLFLDILCDIYMEFRSIPEQNAVLKAAFPNAPDLKTMMYNASLMFVVSHISIHDPLPLQPSIKYIGGHHVGSLKPLPIKIKQFMENASEGVIVFQTVPAHPNTVAFISHGGLLGMIESVFFGVPILGIPTYWDQYKNIEDVVRRGMAVKLNLHDLTEETFSNALNEILNDPK
nr:UDP-glucuronosyltransferase 2C1-like [Leptinotarsa decemlineata]